jgi:hypothetical protein
MSEFMEMIFDSVSAACDVTASSVFARLRWHKAELRAEPLRVRAIGFCSRGETERSENHGGSLLHNPQTGGQQLSIALPELYVVRRCGSRLEPEGFAHRERDGFRFGFTNLLGRLATPFAPMQQFMGGLMHQGCEFLGGG